MLWLTAKDDTQRRVKKPKMNKYSSWHYLFNYLNSCGVVHPLQGDVVGGDHSVVDPATERWVWSFRRSESLISLSSLLQMHHFKTWRMWNWLPKYSIQVQYFTYTLHQGGHKEMSSFYLTNSALVYEPMSLNGGRGGGGAGFQPMSLVVHNAHGAQINFGDLNPNLT